MADFHKAQGPQAVSAFKAGTVISACNCFSTLEAALCKERKKNWRG